uniref:Guanine nucleotide-binding protein G(O) subunit alpha n=1 Tax=Rhabditophanes sp. KR3021 TaxID=114890 RepID=A0AC35TX30_9BILA
MGAITSSCQTDEAKEEYAKSKAIEKQLQSDKRASSSIIKLLLLGAGECGKSTILKQMQLLHSNGFSEDEINEKKAVVYSNVLTSISAIIKAMENTLKIEFADPNLEGDRELVRKIIDANEEQQPFSDELTVAIDRLWKDEGVQRAYEQRSTYQINDSAKHFLDSVRRIHEPGYRPTEQDILFSRQATSGVIEVKFKIKDLDFRVFDVGGQRSERKKWIHCFDNVESIIFICAVSEYDQVLFEDESTNRMQESMQLFQSICNSSWFQNTAMIVFFNKKDLFAEKILKTNITTAFPEYDGGQNYEEAMNFIKLEFSKLNQHPDKKTIYMHETCATDTDQVQLVISSVIDTIIQVSYSPLYTHHFDSEKSTKSRYDVEKGF